MTITDGKRTVEIRTVLFNRYGSGNVAPYLVVDSTMKNGVHYVHSVQDVLDYCQEWENVDPANRYFDYGEV